MVLISDDYSPLRDRTGASSVARISLSMGMILFAVQMAGSRGESMIPHEAFVKLREDMNYSDTKREEVIKKSRGRATHITCMQCLHMT